MGGAAPDFQLSIRAYLAPNADRKAVPEKLAELYEALSDYTFEKYGTWLTVKEFEQFVRTGVFAPVGG
ncbi:MAG: hypothetical protein FJ304_16315 [Planctomycetes bacterium]|nr:hypothetical protein [Planctomycetota bacterium]